MRLSVLFVFTFLVSLSASAQSVVALTRCCPNEVVMVDPVSGERSIIAEVGTESDLFIASVGSVAIDVDGQRGFLVRNRRFAVADLATGIVTEGPDASSITQLAGFDTARNQLLAFATEVVLESESPRIQRFTNYIVAYQPTTQDTIRIAKVGEAVEPAEQGEPWDSFSSAGGPAVAGGETLFTIRNSRLLKVDLASGSLSEGDSLTGMNELLGYDSEFDALYRLRRETVTSGGLRTITARVLRQSPGSDPEILATVAEATIDQDGGMQGDIFLGSFGVAVYDAIGDRIVMNRNGSLVIVDLATGAVTNGLAAPVGMVGGALIRGVAAASPARYPEDRITIAPNPVRGHATISLDGVQSARIDVFDALGRHVAALLDGVAPNQIRWNTDGLTHGVYWIRAVSDGVVSSLPLTVIR